MVYDFQESVKLRFIKALRAAVAVPFIDDIEDFIVESIWAYANTIQIPDPFFTTRSKKLYDVVDPEKKTGWSVKSVQYAFAPGTRFELVIQRADIFKKANALGYESLSINTDPQILGEALLKHWQEKVTQDAAAQGVDSKRVFILLKQRYSYEYAMFEEDIRLYSNDEISWHWTDNTHTGLQGTRKSDKECVYRWYPNQKQLFEGFFLPEKIESFSIAPVRIPINQAVDLLVQHIEGNQ